MEVRSTKSAVIRAIVESGEGLELTLEVVRESDTLEKTVRPELGEARGLDLDFEAFARKGRHQLEHRVEELERRLREFEQLLRRELDLRTGPLRQT